MILVRAQFAVARGENLRPSSRECQVMMSLSPFSPVESIGVNMRARSVISYLGMLSSHPVDIGCARHVLRNYSILLEGEKIIIRLNFFVHVHVFIVFSFSCRSPRCPKPECMELLSGEEGMNVRAHFQFQSVLILAQFTG